MNRNKQTSRQKKQLDSRTILSNDHNLYCFLWKKKRESTLTEYENSIVSIPLSVATQRYTYGWLFQSLRYPLSRLHRAVEASQSSRKPDKCLVLVRFCWEWTIQHRWERHKRSTAQYSTNTAQQNRGQKWRWWYAICLRSTTAPTE